MHQAGGPYSPTGLAIPPRTNYIAKFAKDFTAGGWAAVVAKTIIAPVERVKLILQLQSAQPTIDPSKRYRGMVDCFVRVPREQGFLSFWRGNWSNILRASSQESLGIAFKEFFRRHLVTEKDREVDYARFAVGNLLSGGLSGCATFCFIYPLDFSRTRLAIDMGRDSSSREFKGLLDCLVKIGRHDGFIGLYRGFIPSLQYIFLYRAMYYGLFDTMKASALDNGYTDSKDLSFALAFGIAQCTAFIAAMFSYPLDTVRRRIMMQAGKEVRAYDGTIDCARKIFRVEGVRAFFNGAFVNSIRGVGAALVLALYNEMSKHY